MSQMNQIIASLLSDINEAKSKADESSRNLAQQYAADEILRYFPVPKIGIQNLEVEIKYAIESVEEKPIQSSQSQQRLTAFIQTFSNDTAKEIRAGIRKAIQENELYKSLGTVYPPEAWEKSLSQSIEDGFMGISRASGDLQKAIKTSFESFGKVLPQFLPIAYKSESLAAIPKISGEYQLVGLAKDGTPEFTVSKLYTSEKEALSDARILNTSISTKKVEIVETRKDAVAKVDLARIKAGNQEFMVEMDSQKVGAVQPKAFFERSFSEKSTALNTPIRIAPSWLSGRIPTVGTPTPPSSSQPSVELKEDDALKVISETIMKKRLADLEFGISKILNENKATTIQVMVESEKLKQLKPENLATIKFSLSAQDFTMMDDESKKSIL